MKKAYAMKWVNALRSGKFKQTTGVLQDYNGYCCLDVACKIFIPKKYRICDDDGELTGTVPTDQSGAPEWLRRIEDIQFNGEYLTDYNDTLGYSFDEIADIIQIEYVEGYE